MLQESDDSGLRPVGLETAAELVALVDRRPPGGQLGLDGAWLARARSVQVARAWSAPTESP